MQDFLDIKIYDEFGVENFLRKLHNRQSFGFWGENIISMSFLQQSLFLSQKLKQIMKMRKSLIQKMPQEAPSVKELFFYYVMLFGGVLRLVTVYCSRS